jgi:hypothetical protein
MTTVRPYLPPDCKNLIEATLLPRTEVHVCRCRHGRG